MGQEIERDDTRFHSLMPLRYEARHDKKRSLPLADRAARRRQDASLSRRAGPCGGWGRASVLVEARDLAEPDLREIENTAGVGNLRDPACRYDSEKETVFSSRDSASILILHNRSQAFRASRALFLPHASQAPAWFEVRRDLVLMSFFNSCPLRAAAAGPPPLERAWSDHVMASLWRRRVRTCCASC